MYMQKYFQGVINMKKMTVFVLGLLLVLNLPLYGVTKVGTTAAPFLVIDVGPRATAMGSAYVSVVRDATAMYWNPAGIARLNNNIEAAFCNTRWIADIALNYAGVAFRLGSLGTLGVNATLLTMDEMERTTVSQPDGTGEYFDAGSSAFGLSYARNLTDRFAIGLNAKYINERIYHCNANGFALDVGALYATSFHGLTLGMNISNYGTKMQLDGRDLLVQVDINQQVAGNNPQINAKLETDQYDLPLMFRFGLSMDLIKGKYNNLIIAADALHPSDDVEYVNVGAEYTFFNILSLRAGYKQLFAQETEQGLTFGGGIHYNVFGTSAFSFDYSYINFGVFQTVNMFSIGLSF